MGNSIFSGCTRLLPTLLPTCTLRSRCTLHFTFPGQFFLMTNLAFLSLKSVLTLLPKRYETSRWIPFSMNFCFLSHPSSENSTPPTAFFFARLKYIWFVSCWVFHMAAVGKRLYIRQGGSKSGYMHWNHTLHQKLALVEKEVKDKHCQRHNGPKALNTLTYSTPLQH